MLIRRVRFGELLVDNGSYGVSTDAMSTEADDDTEDELREALCCVAYRVLDLLPRNVLDELDTLLPPRVPLLWYERSLYSQQHLRSMHIRSLERDYSKQDVSDTAKNGPNAFFDRNRLDS